MPISSSTSSSNAQPAKVARDSASSKRDKSAGRAKANNGKGGRAKSTRRDARQKSGAGESEQVKSGGPKGGTSVSEQTGAATSVATPAETGKVGRPASAAKEAQERGQLRTAQAQVVTLVPEMVPITGGSAFAGLPEVGKALGDGVSWAYENLSGNMGRLSEKFFGQTSKQAPSPHTAGEGALTHHPPARLTAEGGPFHKTYYAPESSGAGASDSGNAAAGVSGVYLEKKKKIVTGPESPRPSVAIPITTEDRGWNLNDIETTYQYQGDANLAAWLMNKKDDDYVAQVSTDLWEINKEIFLRANLFESDNYQWGEGDRVSPTLDRAIRMADVNEKKLFLTMSTPITGRVNKYQLQALGFEYVKHSWGPRGIFKDEGWVLPLDKIRKFLERNPGL